MSYGSRLTSPGTLSPGLFSLCYFPHVTLPTRFPTPFSQGPFSMEPAFSFQMYGYLLTSLLSLSNLLVEITFGIWAMVQAVEQLHRKDSYSGNECKSLERKDVSRINYFNIHCYRIHRICPSRRIQRIQVDFSI